MACPFCEINKEKTRILHIGEYSNVILSNPRLMPGHLLVIPKRHISIPHELENQELEEIMHLIINYQKKIIERKISEGCDIRQNYRPFQKDGRIKQSHLHFHLLPRNSHDELYLECQKYETPLFRELEKEEIDKIQRLLE